MKNCTIVFPLALLLLFACQRDHDRISYNQHIRPIFNQKCLPCHGGVKKQGGFSLLFREEAMGEMESGKIAIVPGKHRQSELFQRIIHKDPEMRMPHQADPLSATEIHLITQWIDEGAEWEDHWAYVAPQMPDIPSAGGSWARSEMDHFIYDRLEKEGLSPAPEADASTLLRRVSFDLIGLPPTEPQIRRFLDDPSEENYALYIDELLNSPHFGERWAAMWLDLARYADSQGYEKDPHRNIWRYREWVIKAFNQDMPFDRFTIEQLAGDLMDDPSRDQLIATAFHRNAMTNTEGGTDDEEFRMTAVLDRLTTTFDVWQGTTIGCVQCHSHPYDPFRHEEFYELAAIFNNTQDADLSDETPNLELYAEGDSLEMVGIISYIQNLNPEITIDYSLPLARQVKAAVFPTLIPNQCDDYWNVQFYGSGVTNWAVNLLMGKKRRYFFKFDDIDLNGLAEIAYTYKTDGNDARLVLRLDSLEGEAVQEVNFSSTKEEQQKGQKKQYRTEKFSLQPASGTHDLVFELINTTGEIPDGNVVIDLIQLNYEDKYTVDEQLLAQQTKLAEMRSRADYTPIMLAKSDVFRRQTHVFERGNFLMKGEEVQPDVPAVLPPMQVVEAPRLAFAKWLVSTDNPLTARVIVNRFWEQIFGTGIVETVEDFGTQGFKPTHPELLDYLALQFMHQHQWSVKSLLKEIVLSSTYRQSSKVVAEKLNKDPFNHLISRGTRFRLSAEQIRDQALAVGGLLYDTIGGPSVMPPQPEGIWQVVYSGGKWETAEGKNKYRRGIYTYWRRTTPYPSMLTFDSPSREFCVSRRIRTNTPLQALVTLNDPVFVEAAQALGRRMREKGNGDLQQSIYVGHLLALAKKPDAETMEVLTNLYLQAEKALAPEAVPTKLVEDTGLAIKDPITVVANAIMNLDAFMMKE